MRSLIVASSPDIQEGVGTWLFTIIQTRICSTSRSGDGANTESEEVAPGMVLDFNEENRVIGIEIEDASTLMDLLPPPSGGIADHPSDPQRRVLPRSSRAMRSLSMVALAKEGDLHMNAQEPVTSPAPKARPSM